MRKAMAIVVSDEQWAALEGMVRSQTIDVRAARCARIVLLADAGLGDRDIARQLDIGRIQAARWRGWHSSCTTQIKITGASVQAI